MKLAVLVMGLFIWGFSYALSVYVVEYEIERSMMGSTEKGKEISYYARGMVRVDEEKEVRTSSMPMPMPGMEKFMRNVPSDGSTRKEKRTNITLIKGDKVVVYNINHNTKTYVKTEMPIEMLALGLFPFLECDVKSNQDYSCRVNRDTIKPTGETRKIGKWKARKVVFIKKMTMGSPGMPGYAMETKEIRWMTRDNKLLLEIERKAFSDFVGALKPETKKLAEEVKAVLEEIWSKYGASVLTEIEHSMGVRELSAVKKVYKKDVPENFFRPPEGYKEMAIPMMKRGMGF